MPSIEVNGGNVVYEILGGSGDLIVLTIGEPIGAAGGTNTMKIVRVGDHRKQRGR